MNALQQFIQSKPCGFLTDADMPKLIELDRLFPVLVRCGGCRFTCGAQYLAHLIQCIEAGGDYVRDVSFPVGSLEWAADWRAEPQVLAKVPKAERASHGPEAHQKRGAGLTFDGEASYSFDESQCGGLFDGNTVTSDCDPGL